MGAIDRRKRVARDRRRGYAERGYCPRFLPFQFFDHTGSGWVILAYSPRDKRLVNQWAADHTTTLAGGRPVLVLDMYEHAYHMDYGAAAAKYVDIYMDAIRWDNATKLYEQYSREA
jgi:superoxide dismutase